MDSFLHYALRYGAIDRRIIPLRGKDPFTPHGVLDASADQAIIHAIWTRSPNANIGWALGTEFWVLDVDPRHGGDESLEALERQYGRLPDTLQQMTGGGGRHYVWRRPLGIDLRQSTGLIGPGLDVKTGNGYIVVAPSIHPDTGNAYEWDGITEFEDQEVLLSPDWLLTAALNGGRPATPQALPDIIPHGQQHNSLVSLMGTLRNRGLTEEEIFQTLWAVNQRCEKPGPEENIRKMAHSAMNWAPGPGGRRVNAPPPRQPADAENTDPINAKPAENAGISAIDLAEIHLLEVIASKDVQALYNGPMIAAVAAAGDIKRHEAKRRLKAAFGRDFSVDEWNSRLKAAIGAIRSTMAAQPDEYILTAEGAIKPCTANAIIMMEPLKIQYNAFLARAFLTEPAPWGTVGTWRDYDDIKCAQWCQHARLAIEKNTVADACEAIARDNTPWYHPVVEYLSGLEWDGVPRLDTWLTDYLGVAPTDYTRNVGVKWLIQGVKRVYEPGCQADYTIVFEGGQGKRKSTALRILAVKDEWFTDDISDIGDKDSAIQLQGKWIIELGELDAVRRAREITTVKAWLTRRHDHFRPPYGRRAEDFPRHCVFAATTNKEDWLTDDTGGRRYWPVKIGKIDIAGLEAVRDQLWAEAVFRYNEGELAWFSEEIESLAVAEQHERQDSDAWHDLVEAWIASPFTRAGFNSPATPPSSRPGRIYLPEVLTHCLGVIERDWTAAHKYRVARILTMAGYIRYRVPAEEAESDGRRPEYWIVKPD